MNYNLLKDVIDMLAEFERNQKENQYPAAIDGFKQWVADSVLSQKQHTKPEPEWEGKEKGRSPESVINTLIVHMNRYAKTYSKSAIANSDFSTQEDFIYLINLKAFGAMTKMDLIKKNIQEKPAGMKIIERLLKQGWVEQEGSVTDKRSKMLYITMKGLGALDREMSKIRYATKIVTGDLNRDEKMELIRLLSKLEAFHHPIYCKHMESTQLIGSVLEEHPFLNHH